MEKAKKTKNSYTFFVGDKKVVIKAKTKEGAIKLLNKISNV